MPLKTLPPFSDRDSMSAVCQEAAGATLIEVSQSLPLPCAAGDRESPDADHDAADASTENLMSRTYDFELERSYHQGLQ